jgi:arsenate reductase
MEKLINREMKQNVSEAQFDEVDILESLSKYISSDVVAFSAIPEERKRLLHELADQISNKVRKNLPVELIFICTLNSRRSQMSQLWAQVAAHYYKISRIHCYSGGTEATDVNSRAVHALQRAGFHIEKAADIPNPVYRVNYATGIEPEEAFSKEFSDPGNPQNDFIAVMTCSAADDACPLVPGAEARFSIPYEDPKVADNTAEEEKVYDECCLQIAAEMFYVFSTVKQ